MIVYENHTKDESDVKITLMNGGTPENGPDRLGERSDAKRQGGCQEFIKKNIIIIIIAVIVFLLVLASVGGNIFQGEQIKKLQAIASSSNGCPYGWSRHGDRCYFFSILGENWNYSHRNCSLSDASFLTLDSKEEWDLIKSKEEEYWIDLQRKNANQSWKWPDGSNVTQFEVKGTGFCGYVSGNTVSSTTCDDSIRHWVCRKSVHAA